MILSGTISEFVNIIDFLFCVISLLGYTVEALLVYVLLLLVS